MLPVTALVLDLFNLPITTLVEEPNITSPACSGHGCEAASIWSLEFSRFDGEVLPSPMAAPIHGLAECVIRCLIENPDINIAASSAGNSQPGIRGKRCGFDVETVFPAPLVSSIGTALPLLPVRWNI